MGDRSTEIEDHLDALLGQLSLEQKVRLVSGADFWSTGAEPSIGLGRIVMSDGPVGVRGELWDERDPSVCLPSATAWAATWDEGLVARAARLLAQEAIRKGVHVLLGPTLNLHRSPRGGRHFESYSEDPLLTGRIGAAYVRALQSCGIGACPKHYVSNDSENERFTVDVRVDERTLRELYLAPFEDLVSAGAWVVMSAYNGVNGHPMSENPLLTEPLKGEWAFDGVVVSDWDAVRSTEPAGAAGNDLAMPGPAKLWGEPLLSAVRAGRVSATAIDEKVRRILRLAGRVGVLDGVPRPPAAIAERVDATGVLREAAASSMVLLCNENDLLPLDAPGLRRVAVIGPHAADPQIQGGGSVQVVPSYAVSPLDGIRAALDDSVEVVHHVGVRLADGLLQVPVELLTNPATGQPGVQVRYLDVAGAEVRTEDRRATRLVWMNDAVLGIATIELRTRLRARDSGTHRLGFIGGEAHGDSGARRLEVNGRPVDDETDQLYLGAGDEVDIVATYRLDPDTLQPTLTLGLHEPVPSADEVADAALVAESADAAVVVVGTTERDESEGFDRATLSLPGRQEDLVRAVAKANPRTVVVVNSGAPVELSWHVEVPAVLVAWFPGQEFGNALADVLFGAWEPAGRLPTTWAAREADVPVLRTRPAGGRLDYAEGLHVGYRAWARHGTQPAYPFGHGLGYTTWDYRSIDVGDHVHVGEPTTVRVRVANTGCRSGREVVQVYLQRADSAIERPVLWLAGFGLVAAEAGEQVEIEVDVAARAFQHWSTASSRWETEPGRFTVLVGRSAADLPLHGEIVVAPGWAPRGAEEE